jgi:signal peptidase I
MPARNPTTLSISKRKPSSSLELGKTLLYAGLIAVIVRTLLFEPFNIPSGSMKPTLLVGDYVFVSKFSYGYSHFSLPFAPDLFNGRIFGRLPDRGDVVVFRKPSDPRTDYIKRIIGLPGDRIQVKGGRLYINGTEVPRHQLADFQDNEEGNLARFDETLPNGGVRHDILKSYAPSAGMIDQNNTIEYVVPKDHVFAMGDNRDNSLDSRFPPPGGVGFVPLENLIGKADVIFLSIDGTAPWWEFWWWPFEIRYNRLLTVIH